MRVRLFFFALSPTESIKKNVVPLLSVNKCHQQQGRLKPFLTLLKLPLIDSILQSEALGTQMHIEGHKATQRLCIMRRTKLQNKGFSNI